MKWVYMVKKDNSGSIAKYKTQLVPSGFVQKKGIDFEEVFALVAQIDTI